MTIRVARRVQSAAALVALVAGVFGVPLVLAALAGWPLPNAVPSFDRLRVSLEQGDIPADVVLKTLAVVAWVIWLQFVWAVVWELAVNIRRTDRSQRPVRAPMVANVVGTGVARLIVLAFSIGTVTLNSASVAVALPDTPSSVFAPLAAEVTVSPIAHSYQAGSDVCWAVHDGDTLWHIAQASLGDGSRASDILELNSFIRSPRDVRVGQQLHLPADGVVPLDRRPESSAVGEPPVGAIDPIAYLAPAPVVIEPGDTLWGLSEERLDEALAAPVRPTDVVVYLDQVIALNADVVEDPNLIYPGEEFDMPAVGAPPPPPPATRLPSPAADDHEMAAPVPPIASDAAHAVETVPSFEPPSRFAPAVTVPDQFMAPAGPSRDGSTSNSRNPVETPVGSSERSSPASAVPWLAGISGATVLSSAILVAYRRRRQRQATRGAAVYRQAAHQSMTVESLVAAADVNLVTWAAKELGVVFAGLRPSEVVGVPLAAEISETCGLELLWSHRNASAPAPWEAIDGGWSWRLGYDPDRPTPADPAPHPLPALVTIGTRDGHQLLLNVEAFGSVAVTGDRTAAEGLVRAIAVELGSNDLSADSFVHAVGFRNEMDAHFERLTSRSESDAFDHARSMVASHDAVLAEANLDSSFALRLGGDAAGRESTVVIADTSQLTNSNGFVELVRPCRGVALVALGELECAGATIQVMADGTAVIDQLDLEFQAAGLPEETVERLSDILDEAIEPVVVGPIDRRTSEFLREVDAEPASAADSADVPAHGDLSLLDIDESPQSAFECPEVLVRVLGPPTVEGFSQLGRVETNIVTFLAAKNGSSTKDQLVHAVWGGRLVSDQTLFNRVAKTRAVLGDYLPARTRSSVTIDLDRRVGTDLDVLVRALQDSVALSAVQAIVSLTAALDLVRGVPFDGADFDWAHEQQFVADACETVEAATLRVVKLALELGDPASARPAICHGLRALPGNEPIYRARMQVEHALGNIDGVNGALRELTSVLLGAADDGFEFDPSPETVELHRRLSASGQRG